MVLAETRDGAIADFIVVMREQGDLGPAYQMSEKSARGAFVYSELWRTAQNSQAGLRELLDARGISYRSFYVAEQDYSSLIRLIVNFVDTCFIKYYIFSIPSGIGLTIDVDAAIVGFWRYQPKMIA